MIKNYKNELYKLARELQDKYDTDGRIYVNIQEGEGPVSDIKTLKVITEDNYSKDVIFDGIDYITELLYAKALCELYKFKCKLLEDEIRIMST